MVLYHLAGRRDNRGAAAEINQKRINNVHANIVADQSFYLNN